MLSRLARPSGRSSRRASRTLPVLVSLVALSTACGSTVAPTGSDRLAGGDQGGAEVLGQDPTLADPGTDELGLPLGELGEGSAAGDGAGIASGDAPAGGGPVSSGGAGGGAGSAPAAGPAPAGTAPGTAKSPAGSAQAAGMPAKGRGYDEKTLLIGVGIQRGASESGKAIGVNPPNTGSQQRQVEAVIADINARGGILGRSIKPIYHEMTTAEFNSSRSGAQQAACETWTVDNQVFAAVSTSGSFQLGNSPIYECLAKKDTPLIFADNLAREKRLYDRYPSHLFTPGMATVERFGPGLIKSLNEQQYFTGWNTQAGAPGPAPVKVGVLYTSDEPGLRAVYTAALASVGQRDPEFFQLSAKSTQDLTADVAAAVLRFRSNNVTHVLTNGALLFFGPAAHSQGYRPRLGVGTWDALGATAQAVRPESLAGALGAGYMPHLDVTQANAPQEVSPVEVRCREIMEKAGQPPSARTVMFSMLTICEDFWLIESSLKRGGALTTAAMRAGVEAQSQPVVAGLTFAMRYGPGQHDGAHAVRSLAYVDGSFRYTSGDRPLG